MEKYYHGVRVIEADTPIPSPVVGTSGLQVIFGTAPVNLAKNPTGITNIPVICKTFDECKAKLGYSDDWKSYTLCQSMDASFRVFNVAPVIFVNVLDPKKHKTAVEATDFAVSNGKAKISVKGLLLDSIVIKSSENTLVKDTDYILTFDSEGYVIVTILSSSTNASVTQINVAGEKIDPSAVTEEDIIGGYDSDTGKESGIELVRKIYPMFGLAPSLLLAPGWSHKPAIGAVLSAKCEEINGVFTCETVLDLDSSSVGAAKYTDCETLKKEQGYTDKHSVVLWPMVKKGSKIYYYSAIFAALTSYTDISNDDVPNLSPSNRLLRVDSSVLEDGSDVLLDIVQANELNACGIVTAINSQGYKAWGNNSACYPEIKIPRDRFWPCRRFFSWWANTFILTYFSKVDNPGNRVLIESICDAENIRGNSYVSQGKCAGARIEFTESDNPISGLIDGKLVFRQHLAQFTPAEDIVNILSFDPDMLEAALTGGEE
jgi:phage tail sheath protein FI|uniref:Tail sheath tube n=1 Tax=Caudovirales sp. ctCiv1 TaxID=2826769 RepID=A0A8S5M8C1_9CAUD|nr:phage tail sheath family protein [uncultured Lachnoclostridium sp.]DAD78541.1 MAG TPA: tail sheath tube [Caudovirales sp. ctCiv1]